jgi:hypothetical protein
MNTNHHFARGFGAGCGVGCGVSCGVGCGDGCTVGYVSGSACGAHAERPSPAPAAPSWCVARCRLRQASTSTTASFASTHDLHMTESGSRRLVTCVDEDIKLPRKRNSYKADIESTLSTGHYRPTIVPMARGRPATVICC